MGLLDDYIRIGDGLDCPICHNTGSWCLVAADGLSAVCPRVPSHRALGTAGYLHRLTKPVPIPHAARRRAALKPKLTIRECEALQAEYVAGEMLNDTPFARLRFGFDGEAMTCPMRDAHDNIIGFRRRFPNGLKRSVVGSREGLFYPVPLPESDLVFVCEGPTDTLAAMQLGFAAIGRPNCRPYGDLVEEVLDRMGAETVVIVADNDGPGKNGAKALDAYLVQRFPLVHCIVPRTAKDLREFVAVQHENPASFIMSLVDTRTENEHWSFL